MPKRSRSRSRSPVKSKSIYCLKCKKKTGSTNSVMKKDKRGHNRVACKCAVCGTKKSMYV